eukprot:12933361-Prorocentrum_lima.AAC.1
MDDVDKILKREAYSRPQPGVHLHQVDQAGEPRTAAGHQELCGTEKATQYTSAYDKRSQDK